jgi:site-specific DNA-methyltransferase (adenine-specific)
MNAPSNSIILGNCIDVMQAMPARSVDFILTDPPYIASYRSRDNQTLRNDDNAAWLAPSFAAMHRVLKNDACAISFYGWPKVDLFFAAWKRAGFRIGGHIVFRKRYASKTAFLQYRHEAAYLLVKGNPAFPENPLPDVMDWTYTGNKHHPTQKSIHILKPLIEAFTKPGDLVLDPFAGSGSTCVAAHRTGRDYIGIELDATYHGIARQRLDPLDEDRSLHAGSHQIAS